MAVMLEPTRQTNRPEEKRTRLLAAARVQFATRGYSASIAQICHEAQVAIGTFYSHFDDKAGLMAALIDQERGRLVTIDSLPLQRRADLELIIAKALRDPDTALYRTMREAVETDAELRGEGRAFLQEARDRLACALRRARAARPTADPTLDPDTAAWAAIAMAWHALGPATLVADSAADRLCELIELLVFGEAQAPRP